MDRTIEKIFEIGIIPVIKIDDPQNALPLAKALYDGGLPVMEITFRTDAAEESIRTISTEMPEVLVGAGTVLTPAQAKTARDAGAKFIVTPGFNPKVVRRCIDLGLPVIPGASTPTEMEVAMEFGLDLVKFFPAEQSGGPKYLKAVGAPYPGLRFIPTGGVNAGNLKEYLALPNVIACGGSWMAPDKLISGRDFAAITELTKKAVADVLGFEFSHIGLDFPREDEAAETARLLCALFHLEYKEDRGTIFCGSSVGCMKSRKSGTSCHFAIATDSMPRALAYFKRIGVKLDEQSAEYSSGGSIRSVFLASEFAGVRIQIVEK